MSLQSTPRREASGFDPATKLSEERFVQGIGCWGGPPAGKGEQSSDTSASWRDGDGEDEQVLVLGEYPGAGRPRSAGVIRVSEREESGIGGGSYIRHKAGHAQRPGTTTA